MTRHRGEVCCGNCGARIDVNLTITGTKREQEDVSRETPIGPPVPDDLKGWLESTKNFRHLAHDRYGAWWDATVRAFDTYPFIYFDEELRKADAWCEANPRRKPKDGRRFLTNWLNTAVDKGRREEARLDAARRR